MYEDFNALREAFEGINVEIHIYSSGNVSVTLPEGATRNYLYYDDYEETGIMYRPGYITPEGDAWYNDNPKAKTTFFVSFQFSDNGQSNFGNCFIHSKISSIESLVNSFTEILNCRLKTTRVVILNWKV